jgi:hypothetical protein
MVDFGDAVFFGGRVDFGVVGTLGSPPIFDFTDPPPGVRLPVHILDAGVLSPLLREVAEVPPSAAGPSATTDEPEAG